MIRKNRNKIIISKALNPKIGIVVSGYHKDITYPLKEGAIKELLANSVLLKNISTVIVPGSFEIPLALKRMADANKYDSLIGIGCIIKGETGDHYFLSSEVSRGIIQIRLDQ